VEAKTRSGVTLRQRILRDRKLNRLEFVTTEEVVEVVVGPGGIYPDMDSANNRWRKAE